MGYSLSASRLQTYHRCPQAYYFEYERGLKSPAAFGAANLGKALHQTLATIYQDWHYQTPMPWAWVQTCWETTKIPLTPSQTQEGAAILQRYYDQHLTQDTLARPVAVEGRIQATLQVDLIEFTLTGRYDRLDWDDPGLALIDYKSAKNPQIPDEDAIDVQLGLYYLALEKRYHQSLKRMSLYYLRTGEIVTFTVTPQHRANILNLIEALARKLQADSQWSPQPGDHCHRCSHKNYCPALCPNPEDLPDIPQLAPPRSIQLALSF